MTDERVVAVALEELANAITGYGARIDQLAAARRDLLTPVANIPEGSTVTPCATCAEREAEDYVQITHVLQRLGMHVEADAMAQQGFPLDPRFADPDKESA